MYTKLDFGNIQKIKMSVEYTSTAVDNVEDPKEQIIDLPHRFQKISKPKVEKVHPKCDYIKLDGEICGHYCMKQETANRTKCHSHQRHTNTPCLNCGRGTHSKTGYCANMESGCRYKAIYQSRLQKKKQLETLSATLYTKVEQTCILSNDKIDAL